MSKRKFLCFFCIHYKKFKSSVYIFFKKIKMRLNNNIAKFQISCATIKEKEKGEQKLCEY